MVERHFTNMIENTVMQMHVYILSIKVITLSESTLYAFFFNAKYTFQTLARCAIMTFSLFLVKCFFKHYMIRAPHNSLFLLSVIKFCMKIHMFLHSEFAT